MVECLISKEQKDYYFTHWRLRYNDADDYPFKELEDGCEYVYWN